MGMSSPSSVHLLQHYIECSKITFHMPLAKTEWSLVSRDPRMTRDKKQLCTWVGKQSTGSWWDELCIRSGNPHPPSNLGTLSALFQKFKMKVQRKVGQSSPKLAEMKCVRSGRKAVYHINYVLIPENAITEIHCCCMQGLIWGFLRSPFIRCTANWQQFADKNQSEVILRQKPVTQGRINEQSWSRHRSHSEFLKQQHTVRRDGKRLWSALRGLASSTSPGRRGK